MIGTQKKKYNSSKIFFASFALLALCTLILYSISNHVQPERIDGQNSSDINGMQYHDDRPSPVRRRLSIVNMKTSCKTAPKIKQPSTQGQIPPTYFATYPGKLSDLLIKSIHIIYLFNSRRYLSNSFYNHHRIRITSYTQINNGINRS